MSRTIKDLDLGTPIFIDENGVPNAMNAAWGIQSDYEQITLYLAKHKTTENLKKTKAFRFS